MAIFDPTKNMADAKAKLDETLAEAEAKLSEALGQVMVDLEKIASGIGSKTGAERTAAIKATTDGVVKYRTGGVAALNSGAPAKPSKGENTRTEDTGPKLTADADPDPQPGKPSIVDRLFGKRTS